MEERILVADDDSATCLKIMGILKSEGYTVESVDNGRDVITKVQGDSAIRLLLLDINMPGMSGIETVKKLATCIIKPPKVCFISSFKDKETIVRALKHGGAGYIVKPVTKQTLIEKVNAILHPLEPSVEEKNFRLQEKLNIVGFPFPVPFQVVSMSLETMDILSLIPLTEGEEMKVNVPHFYDDFGIKTILNLKILESQQKEKNYLVRCNILNPKEFIVPIMRAIEGEKESA